MLITYQEFIASGLPVSDDISQYEVEFSINTVEEFYIKPALTTENYLTVSSTPNSPLVKGGNLDEEHYAGLKQAMYHLVFAWMIVNNYRITRYSSVEKNSEFSSSPSADSLDLLARRHWEIGEAFTREVQDYFDIDPHNNTNNLFDSLLW